MGEQIANRPPRTAPSRGGLFAPGCPWRGPADHRLCEPHGSVAAVPPPVADPLPRDLAPGAAAAVLAIGVAALLRGDGITRGSWTTRRLGWRTLDLEESHEREAETPRPA